MGLSTPMPAALFNSSCPAAAPMWSPISRVTGSAGACRFAVKAGLLLAHVVADHYRQRMVIWRTANLLAVLTWIAAPLVLAGSTFAQTAQPSPVPVVPKSACPETLPDVDRVACLVSLAPEAAPARPKPEPPLLRGSDGTPIIGPNSSR